MALFKILDRYYMRLYNKNRAKFLAKFPYKVTINSFSAVDYTSMIDIWLSEYVGQKNRDYRINYTYATNEYWFKNQEESITFALRWM
jgi:hypothetical protein